MNKIKVRLIFPAVLIFSAALLVHAQPDKKVQPGKIGPKGSTEMRQAPSSFSQISQFTGFRQGYRMVTDVLDGFGGQSESANYRIPVNSGGQSSAIGPSQSTNWAVEAGYVNASNIRHGDANADGTVALGDAIYILNYLFRSGPNPCPMEAGDANCDGAAGLGDAIYILNYLFKGGPSPGC
jgi:hypothetical protein